MINSTRDIRHSLKKRRRIAWGRKFLVFLILVGVLLGAFAWFSGSGVLNVKKIEVMGMTTLNVDELTQNIQKSLDGRYLGLFSRSNILILPWIGIKNSLMRDFLKIDRVFVWITGENSIRVSVSERTPVGIWCQSKERGVQGCYFLDKSGFIYTEAPEIIGNSFYYFYGGIFENPIGNTFVGNPKFLRLYAFMKKLKELGFAPISLSALPDNEYEIDLEAGGQIDFNESQSFETSLENIDAMLLNNVVSTSTAFLGKLNHLDLRYGNKVHYDLR